MEVALDTAWSVAEKKYIETAYAVLRNGLTVYYFL